MYSPSKIPATKAGFFMDDYSTKKISSNLLEEIRQAIKNIRGWGTVEIVIQNYKVTQITEKNIKKTDSKLR